MQNKAPSHTGAKFKIKVPSLIEKNHKGEEGEKEIDAKKSSLIFDEELEARQGWNFTAKKKENVSKTGAKTKPDPNDIENFDEKQKVMEERLREQKKKAFATSLHDLPSRMNVAKRREQINAMSREEEGDISSSPLQIANTSSQEKTDLSKGTDEAIEVEDLYVPLGGITPGLPIEDFDDFSMDPSPEQWLEVMERLQQYRKKKGYGYPSRGEEGEERDEREEKDEQEENEGGEQCGEFDEEEEREWESFTASLSDILDEKFLFSWSCNATTHWKSFDAHVLHFVRSDWHYVPCSVLDFDTAANRYVVRVLEGGGVKETVKRVRRLSLRFCVEDWKMFQERVKACKDKKKKVEVEQKLIGVIKAVGEKEVSSLSLSLRKSFLDVMSRVMEKYNFEADKKCIKKLILDVESIYLMSMKWCAIMNNYIKFSSRVSAFIPPALLQRDEFANVMKKYLPIASPAYGLVPGREADETIQYFRNVRKRLQNNFIFSDAIVRVSLDKLCLLFGEILMLHFFDVFHISNSTFFHQILSPSLGEKPTKFIHIPATVSLFSPMQYLMFALQTDTLAADDIANIASRLSYHTPIKIFLHNLQKGDGTAVLPSAAPSNVLSSAGAKTPAEERYAIYSVEEFCSRQLEHLRTVETAIVKHVRDNMVSEIFDMLNSAGGANSKLSNIFIFDANSRNNEFLIILITKLEFLMKYHLREFYHQNLMYWSDLFDTFLKYENDASKNIISPEAVKIARSQQRTLYAETHQKKYPKRKKKTAKNGDIANEPETGDGAEQLLDGELVMKNIFEEDTSQREAVGSSHAVSSPVLSPPALSPLLPDAVLPLSSDTESLYSCDDNLSEILRDQDFYSEDEEPIPSPLSSAISPPEAIDEEALEADESALSKGPSEVVEPSTPPPPPRKKRYLLPQPKKSSYPYDLSNGSTCMLRVSLVYDASTNSLSLSHSPETLKASLHELLERLVESSSHFPSLIKSLLPLSTIEGDDYLSPAITESDLLFQQVSTHCDSVLETCLSPLLSFVDDAKRFIDIFEEESSLFYDFENLALCRLQYDRLESILLKLESSLPSHVNFPLFQLDLSPFLTPLRSRLLSLLSHLSSSLLSSLSLSLSSLSQKYTDSLHLLTTTPSTEDSLSFLKQFLKNIPSLLQSLSQQALQIQAKIELLQYMKVNIPKDLYVQSFQLFYYPNKIKEECLETTKTLEAEREKFILKLYQEKESLQSTLSQLEIEINDLLEVNTYSTTVVSTISKMKFNIDRCCMVIKSLEERETLFELDKGNYQQLGEITERFSSLLQLWSLLSDFKTQEEEYLLSPVKTLNAGEIELSIDNIYKESNRLMRLYSNGSNQYQLLLQLRKDVEGFKQYMNVIYSLSSNALTNRHWKAILEYMEPGSAAGGSGTVPQDQVMLDDNVTLKMLIDLDVLKYQEELEGISSTAQKELSLKKQLVKMKEEWNGVYLELMPVKAPATSTGSTGANHVTGMILKKLDDINTLLDDQIMRIQNVRSSPYVKHIEKEARDWETKLILIQDILDMTMNVQKAWLYLSPIFSSDDIVRALPNESKKFLKVDTQWNEYMQLIMKEKSLVLDLTDIENLLSSLSNSHHVLEEIQRGLSDYLEMKRLAFPRLFFLSNDELLQILSNTKDPVMIQPHVHKCFEGINRVRFVKQDTVVSDLISSDNEVVPLLNALSVVEGDKKGRIERWLYELELEMKNTIRHVCYKAMSMYSGMNRVDWILSFPSQVVLTVNNIFWTNRSQEAINDRSLGEYQMQLQKELNDVIQLIRSKGLSYIHRKTLSALVTIDVHSKDIIQTLLQKDISSEEDFHWISQMRYLWVDNALSAAQVTPGGAAGGVASGDVMMEIMNTRMKYGYEYLGNSDRLVITPLTDRCYRTLVCGYELCYGGAPEGPAGTGKTETTKDLAKACGMFCIVFNCSDGLDYLAMSKFFKGLASSGCWCCFDEFNRIDLEVLSVIAMQVQCIQTAIKKREKTFVFEGVLLNLIPSTAINITMNPGYAGRSELPDNLKTLFRPCAMMVPDYALIAEISLYSYGFLSARILAQKCVVALKISSEQLSSQDHYDFGMRALKVILLAAGHLKRRYGESIQEDQLILRALLDINVPKFTLNDIVLFQGIVSDLFPGMEKPQSDNDLLLDSIKSKCHSHGLIPTDVFLNKCIQLWETVIVRHGIMLVGKTLSAKSMIIKMLSMGLTGCKGGEDGMYQEVKTYYLNPKAIAGQYLYGNFDENTHEWTDGILPLIVREACNGLNNGEELRQWIVLDGPVDALWIENMNTVLDDNKKLCLSSGEIIKLGNGMTMMFEVEDLSVASPATVSRCGMIYTEPEQLGWRILLESLYGRLYRVIGVECARYIVELSVALIEPLLELLNGNCPIVTSSNWLVLSTVRMITAMLMDSLPEMEYAAQKNHYSTAVQFNVASKGVISDEKKGDERRTEDKRGEERKEAEEAKEMEENVLFPTPYQKMNDKDRFARCENITIYSILCCICSMIKEDKKPILDQFLKKYISATDTDQLEAIKKEYHILLAPLTLFKSFLASHPKSSLKQLLPFQTSSSGELLYEYKYSIVNNSWSLWSHELPSISIFDIDKKIATESLTIPTIESIRNDYLLSILSKKNINVLFTGDSGTAKSLSMFSFLKTSLGKEKYLSYPYSLSARTTTLSMQDMIDGKIDKRRKGVYGPPIGKKIILFFDDINLPIKEKYGAQPPIELLRQLLDYNGFYDKKLNLLFKEIMDMNLLIAMGLPGGGRTQLSLRFLRHFNVYFLDKFSNHSLKNIYGTLLSRHLHCGGSPLPGTNTSSTESLNPTLNTLCGTVIDATIELYEKVCSTLLPTPNKSHYIFNLRDVSRLVYGMCLYNPVISGVNNSDIVSLWKNESSRVFGDRINDPQDMAWFQNELLAVTRHHFPSLPSLGSQNTAESSSIFCTFDVNTTNPNIREYKEIKDLAHLRKLGNTYLEEYNNYNVKNNMSIVLFEEALYHLCKITRMIRMYHGNGLLIGLGGSGKTSLSMLSGFIESYDIQKIELNKQYSRNDWIDDIKNVLSLCGMKNKKYVLLLNDNHLNHNITFPEDIASLMNSGEIPNIYNQEEKNNIYDLLLKSYINTMATATTTGGAAGNAGGAGTATSGGEATMFDVYNYYVDKCRENFHVLLCMSPIHTEFRNMLRMYPLLANSSTINWFLPWSNNALSSVAMYVLTTPSSSSSFSPSTIATSEAIEKNISKLCVITMRIQKSIEELCEQVYQKEKRVYPITPLSYIELLKTLKNLLQKKSLELYKNLSRYESGVEKLITTKKNVEVMNNELSVLKPKLQQQAEETEKLMTIIQQNQILAKEKFDVISVQEKECNEQKDSAQKEANICQEELSKALPLLEEAQQAVSTLKPSDLQEFKSVQKPHEGVVKVTEALCILQKIKPVKQMGPDGKTKVDNYWEPAKKTILKDAASTLRNLKSMDVDNIDNSIITALLKFETDPLFSSNESMAKVSVPASNLAKFVLAMIKYDRVVKMILPKRQALKKAQDELQVAENNLTASKNELKELNDALEKMMVELNEAKEKKKNLETHYNDCVVKTTRANKLLNRLGGEQDIWLSHMERLNGEKAGILGNCILAAGYLNYLGFFSYGDRAKMLQLWYDLIGENEIQTSIRPVDLTNGTVLQSILGDSLAIQQWLINKLPNDTLSIDNSIILHNSHRFSLMIDPQSQANKWIKNTYQTNGNSGTSAAVVPVGKKKALGAAVGGTAGSAGASRFHALRTMDENYVRQLELCVSNGNTVLLECMNDHLDLILIGLFQKKTFKSGNIMMIRLGENMIEYHPDFQLYITTTMNNPVYSADVCVSLNVLNFILTIDSLQDQLLAITMAIEEPQMEMKRLALLMESNENKKILFETENSILDMLSNFQGDILNDEVLIDTLTTSNIISKKISERLVEQEKIKKSIENQRLLYIPVVQKYSHIYFIIHQLSNVNHMYRFSSLSYISLYQSTLSSMGKIEDKKGDTGRGEQGKAEQTKGEKSEDRGVASRMGRFDDNFLEILYQNICISLFEKDKLIFSFLLCLRILMLQGKMNLLEMKFLFVEGFYNHSPELMQKKPTLSTTDKGEGSGLSLTDDMWMKILSLENIVGGEIFHDFSSSFLAKENWQRWKEFIDCENPYKLSQWPLDLHSRMTPFQMILLCYSIRPDLTIVAIQNFISDTLGAKFLPQAQSSASSGSALSGGNMLSSVMSMSSAVKPVIFILSPGVDPLTDLQRQMSQTVGGHLPTLTPISLGQGQAEKALSVIYDSMKNGNWVLLQNCHLSLSFLPTLDILIEKTLSSYGAGKTSSDGNGLNQSSSSPSPNPLNSSSSPPALDENYRLLLTTMPISSFPVSILENSLKITNEAPKGIKSNLVKTFQNIVPGEFDNESNEYKRLLFSLSLFHAVIIERKKFGPIGWNIPYEFTDSDKHISSLQLYEITKHSLVSKKISWEMLHYLTAESNYGGRVTDGMDRRLLNSILADYYSPAVLLDGTYHYQKSVSYPAAPQHLNLDETLRFIRDNYSSQDSSSIFGLHSNADILSAINETNALLRTTQNIRISEIDQTIFHPENPEHAVATKTTTELAVVSVEEQYKNIALDLLERLPPLFDIDVIRLKYPVAYEESMNTVLIQECLRYNKMLSVMKKSLRELIDAVRGISLMTPEMNQFGIQLWSNKIPVLWMACSYPSLKSLSNFYMDFQRRIGFLAKWIEEGIPLVFWISGFYFTQSFLSGLLQNEARRLKYPIDKFKFVFEFLKGGEMPKERPEIGCYVNGLFLQGAGWDYENGKLVEQGSKKLFLEMPVIHIMPVPVKEGEGDGGKEKSAEYDCPVYKTSQRAGTLSTTGHSTNFVLFIQLPILKNHTPSHWIKRGVALLTQLDN